MSGKNIYVSLIRSPRYNPKASNIFDGCGHKKFSVSNSRHSFMFDDDGQVYVHHFTDFDGEQDRAYEVAFIIGKTPEKTKQVTEYIYQYLSSLTIGKASRWLVGLKVNATKLRERVFWGDCGLEYLPKIMETYFELIVASHKNLHIMVERETRAAELMKAHDLKLEYKVSSKEDLRSALYIEGNLPHTESEVVQESHSYQVYFGVGDEMAEICPSYEFRMNVRLPSLTILAHTLNAVTLFENKSIYDPRLLELGKKLKGTLVTL